MNFSSNRLSDGSRLLLIFHECDAEKIIDENAKKVKSAETCFSWPS